eukprot:8321951-Pyramimonas_sp.AAC.1
MLQGLETVVFQRSNSATGVEPLSGPTKRKLGERVYPSIVGGSWVYAGPPSPPPPPNPITT